MPTFTTQDLIDWSQSLRDCQRDALRRILEVEELTQLDIEDLAALAKRPYLDPSVQGGAARFPEATATSNSSASNARVALQNITQIVNVNALAMGPVIFQDAGMTAFFGYNGSGKSGIARIIKSATQSVGAEKILSNVHEVLSPAPIAANVAFKVGDEERTFSWVHGGTKNPELAQIHVFDSTVAAHRVSKATKVVYTPQILTLFKRLTEVCKKVKAQLDSETSKALGEELSLGHLQIPIGTSPKQLLQNLTANTPRHEVESACEFSEGDAQRLLQLKEALSEDPKAKLQSEEARLRRLRELEGQLNAAMSRLSDDSIHTLESGAKALDDANTAVATAQEEFARDIALPTTGGSTWKRLWEAARAYSVQDAYPAAAFPNTSDDALCVLCQQELTTEARARFKAFEMFVKGELQRKAEQHRLLLDSQTAQIGELGLPEKSRAVLGDLAPIDVELGEHVRQTIVALRRRRRFLAQLGPKAWRGGIPLPERPNLSVLSEQIAGNIAALKLAAEEEGRKLLLTEKDELESRSRIAPFKPALLQEVQRLKLLSILERAKSDCATNLITTKQGEVQDLLVTTSLKDKFQELLLVLGFSEVPIEVDQAGGSPGEHPHQLKLTTRQSPNPIEVLSEGERTCIALAGLLAELHTAQNCAALVLDDPISSLDHNYRERVAELLVAEAKDRQIIVFTHDLVFLYMLQKHCEALHISLTVKSVIRGVPTGGHGVVTDELPWETMKVTERVKRLRRQTVTARQTLQNSRSEYERLAKEIYRDLRESWERATEEVLLYGAVVRFGESVQTSRLKKIAGDVLIGDVELIDAEMSRCSGYAHDRAGILAVQIPGPDVVEADIKKLEVWVNTMRTTRNRK